MLSALGETELERGPGYILTRNGEGKLRALLWNYPQEITSALPMSPFPNREVAEETARTGSNRRISFQVSGVRGVIHQQTLDAAHGSAYDAWQRMGMPEPPTREQAEELRRQALALDCCSWEAEGTLCFDRELAPWTVMLLSQA